MSISSEEEMTANTKKIRVTCVNACAQTARKWKTDMSSACAAATHPFTSKPRADVSPGAKTTPVFEIKLSRRQAEAGNKG